MVEYEHGLRVIVHTANLIYCDCNNKTQVNGPCVFPSMIGTRFTPC